MAIEGALALEQLPDGVYLGLKEGDYFAQDRLGSSDLIKLDQHKEGWWWQSRWNRDRTNAQTAAQSYGSALHAIMLEGVGAYETRFAVAPDPADYPGLLTTIPQIKEALTEEGFDLKGTSKFQLIDWLATAAVELPRRPCWEAIKLDFDEHRKIRDDDGEVVAIKPAVSAVEDRMLRFMHEAAIEHPDMRQLLGTGERFPVLAEVSVFWTDDHGVRRRARFDKPAPKFTLDLKSLGNWQGRQLIHALGDHIKRNGYHIQEADQHTARKLAHRMIVESGGALLSGGTDEDRAWITAIATRNMPWAWVWLFYQKPEPSGRAPILFPVWDEWKSRFHVDGHRRAVRAVQFYLESVERFGLGDRPDGQGRESRPWSRVEPVHYTDEDLDPKVTLPHYDWEEEPVDGEDEALALPTG